jgi:GDP-L-fucose synthase
VEDAAEGILLATEHYNDGLPVNLGNGDEVSIQELVETIAGLSGFQGRIVWDLTKPNGQLRRKLDARRAEGAFRFRARTGLATGFARTAVWYRERVVTAAR